MEQNLVSQGIELTLFGMGTVVVFLTLLVFITAAMSALVERWLPAPPPPPARTPVAAATDARLLAVITAAIHQHRERHGHPSHSSPSKQDQTP